MRAHQHTVTAGFISRFNHQFVQVVQHVGELLFIPADVGRDVGQNRIFTGVVTDDLGDISVNHLVIGDTRSRGVGQGNPAGFVRFHDTRNAEHGIGTEDLRVDEVVVDPPVDDIHPLGAFCGALVNGAVRNEEIASFDQLDPHLSGQKRVFEIG